MRVKQFYKAALGLLMSFMIITSIFAQDDSTKYTAPLKDFPLKVYFMRSGRYQVPLNNAMSDDLLPSRTAVPWSLRAGEMYSERSPGHMDKISIDYCMCTDWNDPNGKIWNYTYVVPFQDQTRSIKYVVKLDDGKWIHNYIRYPLTECYFNGELTSRTEIQEEVKPEAIDAAHTTADQYVESKVLTNVGLEFTRKLYQWSHFQDNNYIIVEMIIKNVGYGFGENNVVFFGTFKPVKLPEQTIHNFMYGIGISNGTIIQKRSLNRYAWFEQYGFRPSDSLRILYCYDGQVREKEYDSIGQPLKGEDGRLTNYMGQFSTVLYAPKSVDDLSDDMTQPRWTASTPNWAAGGTPHTWQAAEMERKYRYLVDPSFLNYDYYRDPGVLQPPADINNIAPNNGLHEINTDERGFWVPKDSYEYQVARMHIGPYEIPLGDSIKIVFAVGASGLSPKKAWQVGRAWKQGNCTFDSEWRSPLNRPADMTDNDYAKDAWVFSEIDSMFKTAARAKWTWEHGMNIPTPPPPPDEFRIKEEVGYIKLTWSDNAELSSNFEGYRLYRAEGVSDTTLFEKIAEFSKSKGNITHEYFDNNLKRGRDYHYYITSFSISSGPNAYKPGEILESGRYYIETPLSARYIPKKGLAYPNWVDSVRIVPNPYNISEQQFGGGTETDKIAFYNLPEVCTIRIFSENGNLVTTIEHTDGKSDALWVAGGQYMLSDSGQRVVSGIYIAYIQTPDGKTAIRKFVIVR